jgi:hypothetical protein
MKIFKLYFSCLVIILFTSTNNLNAQKIKLQQATASIGKGYNMPFTSNKSTSKQPLGRNTFGAIALALTSPKKSIQLDMQLCANALSLIKNIHNAKQFEIIKALGGGYGSISSSTPINELIIPSEQRGYNIGLGPTLKFKAQKFSVSLNTNALYNKLSETSLRPKVLTIVSGMANVYLINGMDTVTNAIKSFSFNPNLNLCYAPSKFAVWIQSGVNLGMSRLNDITELTIVNSGTINQQYQFDIYKEKIVYNFLTINLGLAYTLTR